jgi:hypothetical protein
MRCKHPHAQHRSRKQVAGALKQVQDKVVSEVLALRSKAGLKK